MNQWTKWLSVVLAGLLPQLAIAFDPGNQGACPAHSTWPPQGYHWVVRGEPEWVGWSEPDALCRAFQASRGYPNGFNSACGINGSPPNEFESCLCERSPEAAVADIKTASTLERARLPLDCTCDAGYQFVQGASGNVACKAKYDIWQKFKKPNRNMCGGNPIYPMTGTKREVIGTGMGVGGRELQLVYDSTLRPSLLLWSTNFHRSLSIQEFSPGKSVVAIERGSEGKKSTVYGDANPCGGIPDFEFGKVGADFHYKSEAEKSLEVYNDSGKLTSVYDATGGRSNYTLSNASTPTAVAPGEGYLLTVTDEAGRTLNFTYTSVGAISTVTDSNGQVITLGYDAQGRMTTLTWPGGSVRTFLYEDAANPWALTGTLDENGSRYATWTYAPSGEALSSEHAGGVEKFEVMSKSSYNFTYRTREVDTDRDFICRYHEIVPPNEISVSKGNGESTTASVDFSTGHAERSGMTQPAGSGCAASTSASEFYANGTVKSDNDFNGNRTCYAYDGKEQEITRVEGLPAATDCATVLPEGATLPAGASKTTTQWHPHWKLPYIVTTEGAVVVNHYNGISMPCSAAEMLPNGMPMPLVCRTEVHARKNGALDPTVPASINTFTYDPQGRLLTATDSRNNTTTYSYYPDTSFTNGVGHTIGDLYQVTNAAGKSVTVNSYDPSGRVLKMTDPNGMVTEMAYTPRGWVTSVSVTPAGGSARVTTYTYDNVGQVTGVTNPDGTTMSMTYDAAHRLVGATDAKGNSVAYTLDNVGNRIAEELKDPSGTLQRTLSRTFDALNRVQQVKLQ